MTVNSVIQFGYNMTV